MARSKNILKVGDKFGMLTVVETGLFSTKINRPAVNARCDCGNIKFVTEKDIKSGNTKSCGCKGRIPNPIGSKFNSLTVISKRYDDHKNMIVTCKCDCGSIKEYQFGAIRDGYTKTCGCSKSKSIDHGCFDAMNDDSMYWAGFIAADGCVTDFNEVKITLIASDYKHINKFAEFTKSTHNIRINESKK